MKLSELLREIANRLESNREFEGVDLTAQVSYGTMINILEKVAYRLDVDEYGEFYYRDKMKRKRS